ncbi:hypothetical protein Pfo_022666 [Paulownia fortunei]|nr:hypothetical protein Pfo_022666 [Paulownia fortunei]
MEATWGLILTSIIVAAFAKWAVKSLNWLWFRPRKLEKFLRKQGLNGNPYRPFLGDLKDYIAVMKAHQRRSIKLSDDTLPHILAYYHQIYTKYGQNSFMWFGPWPRLNIADPELIKEILRKLDVFQKPLSETGKMLTGGLVSHEGEKWAKHRKIINPAFHLEKLKNMVPAIGLSCSSMVDKWKAMVSSSNEDLSGDVISRTAFGSSHEEGRRIFQLQRNKIKLTLQLLKFSFIPGWRYLPTKENRKLKAMNNEIRSLLRGIIDKRQKAMDRGEAIPGDNLLGTLMESNSRFSQDHGNKNPGMSIEDVIEECKLFYFAGSETTSSLLVWTMVLLCKYPEWQTQAREEVMQVFGNSEPSFEGLNHLKTVTIILQEVLRLYPPAPLVFRSPTETVKLGNLTIPAGVHMMLLIGLLHYDPKIWGDDAKEFKPQRFSEGVSNAAKIQSSFIPFSSGPRVCIGQNFAMIEAKIAIAMILQRFSFELSPSYLHAPFSIVTLTPQYGAPLILRSLDSLSVS